MPVPAVGSDGPARAAAIRRQDGRTAPSTLATFSNLSQPRTSRPRCAWANISASAGKPPVKNMVSDATSDLPYHCFAGCRFASFCSNGTPSLSHFGAGAPFR